MLDSTSSSAATSELAAKQPLPITAEDSSKASPITVEGSSEASPVLAEGSSVAIKDSSEAALSLFKERCPPELRRMIYDLALLLPDKDALLESYQKETHEILVPLRGADGYDSDEYKSALRLRNQGRRAILKTKTRTPSLVVALRADPELYAEALESYYRINTFRLDYLSISAVRYHLSEKTLNSVRKVIIPPQTQVNAEDLARMPNLSLLHFRAACEDNQFLKMLLTTVRQNKALKTLIVEMMSVCEDHTHWVGRWVDEINDGFRTNAKLMEVKSIQPMFFWSGTDGQVLSWNEPDTIYETTPYSYKDIARCLDCVAKWTSAFSYDENGQKWREIGVYYDDYICSEMRGWDS